LSNVINATFTPKQTDGGKARILSRRAKTFGGVIDLTMDHADPSDYMPSEYVAPSEDMA
jgi:hypothetical protein